MENTNFKNLGLALSGGGFRAAFFHIGLLASLADTGVLKNVKVLSTVSGGTIIGVLYYLKLKTKLEKRETKLNENEIDEFYRGIIKDVEKEFYDFVTLNIRTKSFLNPIKNTKIFFSELINGQYTRSKHIGELIEEHLYKKYRVEPEKPLLMTDLHISGKDFPKLIINTTNFNSGSSWVFETDKMRQLESNARSNKNISFETVKYQEKDMSLSDVVAASACVPGLFKPIKIKGRFSNRVELNLIDGGIFDNQGIESLIQENCSHFIISDGSKQLNNKYTVNSTLDVVGRTNDMLMSRVRELQVNKLLDTYGKDKIAFMHLLYGTNGVKWTENETSMFLEQQTFNGDEKEVIPFLHLNLLSKIRTDLDSFTEVEAYSLIYCGYKVSNVELEDRFGLISANKIEFVNKAERFFSKSVPNKKFKDQLEISQKRFFKWYNLTLLKIKTYPGTKKSSIMDNLRNGIFNLINKPRNLIIIGIILFCITFGLDSLSSWFIPGKSPTIQISIFTLLLLSLLTVIVFPATLVISSLVYISLKTLDKLFLHLGKIKNILDDKTPS